MGLVGGPVMRPAHQCCGKLVEVHAGDAWSREPQATPPRFPAPPWYEVYGSATDCTQSFMNAKRQRAYTSARASARKCSAR